MSKIIAFAGIEYAGRTTAILNVALLLVKEGYKVLVVDADQTRSKIRCTVNLEIKTVGILEAVTGLDEIVFDNCFIEEKKIGITFITHTQSAECGDMFLLTPTQAESFYEKLKRHSEFDYILVDCGNLFYEALSDLALIIADQNFILLPPEKRSAAWLVCIERMLALIKGDLKYVVSNINEIPEISPAQMYDGKEYEQIPYIFNMREYTAAGEIFGLRPTGRKAQEYLNAIEKLAFAIKGNENEYI